MLEFPPDQTALYQIALFVALWLVLKRLVFDRFLEVLAARRRRTDGALAEARRLREEVAKLRAEHEALMAQVRREAARGRDEIRRQAEAEERAMVDGAREEAARILDELRERASREVGEARAALERETEELSERVARALLGRPS
ncbi:MAG: ATP synthase F0 subunit B [Candidatus Binatia bacterium]